MRDTMTKTYNGWCNRETWLVSLWLNSDHFSRALLDEALRCEGALYDKAEWLEEQLRDVMADEVSEACLWADLLGTALGRVNWHEIIENS